MVGQVRDEFRQDFDAGRHDPMLDVYNEGMGPQGGFRVGGKRQRYSEAAVGSNKRATTGEARQTLASTGVCAFMYVDMCVTMLTPMSHPSVSVKRQSTCESYVHLS